ncbi:unnamed protein product [Arctogadus glacialis]
MKYSRNELLKLNNAPFRQLPADFTIPAEITRSPSSTHEAEKRRRRRCARLQKRGKRGGTDVPSILKAAKKDLISEDMVFPIATVIVDMVVAYRVSMNTQLSDPIKEVTARAAEYFLTQEHFQNASAHSNLDEEIAFFNKVLVWWCAKHGIVERALGAAHAPHLDDKTKMSDLISDLHAL